ncbi:type II toxin-antitoxin system death-on-curing family toxin [Candidatus Bipolaricaulota bacterium]|nr:type II toxin-antitoxin system death-on-curing family toxin [Candidatus Bipolaricaulota bacterium]
MRYLAINQVLLIHERILDKFGGAGGLRDWGLLDSAVNRLRATFDGKDLYPDIFTKAAALGHSLVLNHPFVDGNKRTAWETMKRFLAENDIRLKVARGEIVDLTLRIEDKSLGVEHIASWLKDHLS